MIQLMFQVKAGCGGGSFRFAEQKLLQAGQMEHVADGGLQAGKDHSLALALREFFGANHQTEAGAVDEADVGEVNEGIRDERIRAPVGRKGNYIGPGSLPDSFSGCGGNFAVPNDRAGGAVGFGSYGDCLLAGPGLNELARGGQIGGRGEKVFQMH